MVTTGFNLSRWPSARSFLICVLLNSILPLVAAQAGILHQYPGNDLSRCVCVIIQDTGAICRQAAVENAHGITAKYFVPGRLRDAPAMRQYSGYVTFKI